MLLLLPIQLSELIELTKDENFRIDKTHLVGIEERRFHKPKVTAQV